MQTTKKLLTEANMPILNKCGFEPREDEYIKDGIVYCKSCNTPRCSNFPDSEKPNHYYRHICDCKRLEIDKERELEKLQEHMEKFERLQESSLLGERYRNVKFDNTNISNIEFKKVFDRCKKYCVAYEEIKAKGYGIYLWGACGTGKTHLTACMANDLMYKFNSVLFTNFFEIAKAIKKTFSRSLFTESSYIESLAEVDFLFIDDLGTERVTKDGEDNWLQEKIYDVINKRYNAQKPTVFSSNYNLEQLIKERGIMEKTVSRIAAMSNAIIELSGQDYRITSRKEQTLF